MHGRSLAVLLLVLLLVAVPLAATSSQLIQERTIEAQAVPIVRQWAITEGATISAVDVRRGVLRITAVGPPPEPSPAGLRRALDSAGLTAMPVDVTWTVGSRQRLPAG